MVHGSFRDGGLIDAVHVFVAPRLVGGAGARTAIAGHGFETMAEALALAEWQVEQLDGDVYLHGRLAR